MHCAQSMTLIRCDDRLVFFLYRAVIIHYWRIRAYPVNDIYSISNITESRILPVKIRAVFVNNKKLRACAVMYSLERAIEIAPLV